MKTVNTVTVIKYSQLDMKLILVNVKAFFQLINLFKRLQNKRILFLNGKNSFQNPEICSTQKYE